MPFLKLLYPRNERKPPKRSPRQTQNLKEAKCECQADEPSASHPPLIKLLPRPFFPGVEPHQPIPWSSTWMDIVADHNVRVKAAYSRKKSHHENVKILLYMMTSPTWAQTGLPLSYFPLLRANHYLLDVINPRQYSHTSVVEDGELLRDLLLRRREISRHFSNNFSFFTSLTQTTLRMGSAFLNAVQEHFFLQSDVFHLFSNFTTVSWWNKMEIVLFFLLVSISFYSLFRNDI